MNLYRHHQLWTLISDSFLMIVVFLFFALRGIPAFEGYLGASIGQIFSNYSPPTVILYGVLLLYGVAGIVDTIFNKNQKLRVIIGIHILILLGLTCMAQLRTSLGLVTQGGSTSLFYEYISSHLIVVSCFYAFDTYSRITKLFKAMLLAGVITSLIHISEYRSNPYDLWRLGSLGSTGATYNTLAYNLVAALWCGPISLLLCRKHSAWNLFKLILISIPLLAGVLLTGTKGAVLSLLILIIIVEIIRLERREVKFLGWRSLMMAMLLIGVIYQLGESEAVLRAIDFNDNPYGGRFELLYVAFENTFATTTNTLLGAGIGQFFYRDSNAEYYYPHNLFADLAVNLGFPAALVVLSMVYITLKAMWRQSTRLQYEDSLRILSVQALGLGITGVIAGLIAFKYTSNVLFFLFLGIAARLVAMMQARAQRARVLTRQQLEQGSGLINPIK